MAVRIFFEYNNQVIQLPVNPEEVEITSSSDNKVEEIVKLGSINILRDRKLKSCNFSSFLPVNADGPYVLTKGSFQGPQFYIDFFNKVVADKKPCRFIISDTDVNMLVSIEEFNYGLQGGDDDTYFSISVKEFKTYSAKTVTIQTPPTTTEPAKAKVTEPKRPKTGFSVGDIVIVSGKYWYTSYGDKPFGTFKNFTGKISHKVADKNRKYRYHITTTSGGYRGWVSESQLQHKS